MSGRTPALASRAGETLQDVACACATARQLARVLTQLYDHHLDGSGLEAPQFALLATLSRHGPTTQHSLGRRHGLDKTTVSRNIGLLSRRGWVAVSVSGDRRERLVALTDDGRRTLQDATPRWAAAQKALRASMSQDEWDALFSALRKTARSAKDLHDGLNGLTSGETAADSSHTRRR